MATNRTKVKFIAVSRMSDTTVLAGYGNGSKPDESYKAEAKAILDKLQDVYLKAGERQKIRTANGAWFTTCDSKDLFYLILTDASYQERHAYGLAKELINELSNFNGYEDASEDEVQHYLQDFLPRLLEKYSDVENIENLPPVQSRATEIKEAMAETAKVAESRETINELDHHKTDNVGMLETDFHNNSGGSQILQNQPGSGNKKVFLAVSLALIFAFVLYLIVR